jgi:DNA-binding response OmpR family regulator
VSKQSLLLVDGDTRSLRVLEVSLRKAGFSVTPAVSVADALEKLEINAPELIISETKFTTELDGFELRRRLRASADWKDIPFIFLTAETAIENKIKGLELGVDDYLTKPIYIKEIVTRINILLQKRQRQFLDLKKDGTRFAGRVADMPVVDVIQTIEISRKSGVIQFVGPANRQAAIYFRDGKVVDAEAGTLQGEDAVYRLLTWNEGEFEVEFRTVRRREAITMSSQGLLMEGMRRLDEWSRLLEQLPPLTHRFEIDAAELSQRLGEIPDDNNRILRLFDGKRTLLEVIDGSDFGDLECLQAISRLYFEGLLIDLDPGVRTKRDTGKPMPLTMLEGVPSTPIEEVVSGPIDMSGMGEPASGAQDTTAAAHETGARESTLRGPYEDVPVRGRRESGEIVRDSDVVEEEEIRGPLLGGYRPSSLRLIDEAVAAAQAIEPSLFEPEEQAAPSAQPAASEDTALARINVTTRQTDPRIETARGLVERSPVFAGGGLRAPNGTPKKAPTKPPPLPPKKLTEREIAEAPLLDADPYTSGEFKLPADQELADAPFIDADPDASGEHGVKSDAVPTPIERETTPELEDEGTTDPSRRRLASTARRDDSQGLRMIGSHGRDRAEASGELVPPPARASSAIDTTEPQRELVTILPRRSTRETPVIPMDEPTVESALAERSDAPAGKADNAEVKPSKPAVEPPRRPPPPPRVSVEGGVVRDTGPGRGAKLLIVLASVLAGATVYSYCKRDKPAQQALVHDDGVQVVAPVMPEADALEYGGFGIDAEIAMAPPVDAAAPRADAATAERPRPDAAVVATVARDAAVASTAADAGRDKSKQARALYDQGHEALEDGDAEAALDLLDQSLKLRKTARTYLERARALVRLNRTDEALASIDEAIKLNTRYAPAYEQKGMILWSAQRHAEARPVFEKYLELDPNGRRAAMIRSMLDEPR